MSLQPLLRALEARFYQWALQDFQREIEQNFPFLRRIPDSLSARVIAIMQSLPREQQLRLAVTLVRRNFYGWITPPPPKEWTPEDESILKWYFDRIVQPIAGELEFKRMQMEGLIDCKIDKEKLVRAIRNELDEQLQVQGLEQPWGSLCYRTVMGGFEVETVIDEGTRTWQLSYYHRIRNDRHGLDVDRVSIHRWLGIASVTYWRYITDAEIPTAAQCVCDLCCHFLEAVRELLRELPSES